MKKVLVWVPMGALAGLLAGCLGGGSADIQQWMNEQKAQVRPKVAPLPEPKKFTPQAYRPVEQMDPFSNEKLTQALKQDTTKATANAALVAPELNRRKEPLEAIPLDAMRMVGSLNKAGQLVALVQINNLLYQVKPGNYMGQNYGRVMRITETEMTLREIVQDAAGEWIERPTALQLQERSK